MWGLQKKLFAKDQIVTQTNRWDLLALMLVLCIVFSLAWTARQMTVPYHAGEQIPISLAVSNLPFYALRTVARMLIALVFSLLFTFTVATWAAKNKHAERIIIPLIDILQSVPVLGFLSIITPALIMLFSGSLLGPECAAIFAIFTGQAWNIVLGFYQSLITMPGELREASAMLQLSAWQRFWRIEVPFAMPSLLWNSMMSMSASWFYVVTCEAISVNNQNITLPGIGSYIQLAIDQANTHAVFYAIITMFIVIILYDQLLFRPIVAWAGKFESEQNNDDIPSKPWLTRLLQRTHLLHYAGQLINIALDAFVNFPLFNRSRRRPATINRRNRWLTQLLLYFWYGLLLPAFLIYIVVILWQFIFHTITLSEARHVALLGVYTALRVMILIVLCSLLWVPVGVWVGLRPRVARIVQPIAQILAAFPAYLLFPVVVMFIVKYHLNIEIWTTPLMILGTQWYVLFNVIAGTSALPKELYYAAENFGLRGWLWWRRLILPAIFPYYITGALTAAGGAWNASIVAEVVHWGNTTLRATGLGEYIARYTSLGDYPRIALGISVMCLFVVTINRLVWRPLYRLAETRFQMEG